MPHTPRVAIISPALAAANNGNWQTARRWAAFLRAGHRVELRVDWHARDGFDGDPSARPDVLVALHARRSGEAVARAVEAGIPLALVMTGTDLYRDLETDPVAQRSVGIADRVVCLQAHGPRSLPAKVRPRTVVIEQSSPTRRALAPRRRTVDLLLVGHLRPEKDPMTAVRALARLPDPALRLVQVGGVSEAGCGEAFAAAAAADPRIERHGSVPHAVARRLIARGRVLLLPSTMEGGANVLIESVTCGVPVLVSRIPGSLGLLGDDYPGVFPVGDDAALAALIVRCRDEPGFLASLQAHCAAVAPRFAPARERAAVRALVRALLERAAPESPVRSPR